MGSQSRARYERRRYGALQADLAAWVAGYKLNVGCVDCGYAQWPEALHFDHVDPATKRRELGWRDDRTKITSSRQADAYRQHVAQFCAVRCANCHAHRSRTERHWRTPEAHGGPEPLRLF